MKDNYVNSLSDSAELRLTGEGQEYYFNLKLCLFYDTTTSS
jgi:hypothetical protein